MNCCDKWAEATGKVLSRGGAWYPPEAAPEAQIERDDAKGWNVNGCCGGGCYVLTDLVFCPWCGANVAAPTGDSSV
jgi:hypothetical protein